MFQIHIPISLAKVLDFPEIVTKNNISRLTTYAKNGPDTYPGANYTPMG